MKNIKNKKGFTLIEILIVVVIIGILASLILPRMLQQPEKAILAEGMQYLGVIRRAQEANSSPVGAAYLTVASGGAGGVPVPGATWTQLGLSPLAAGSRFTYACTAGPFDIAAVGGAVGSAGSCSALRAGAAANFMTIGISDGFVYGCGGIYTLTGGGAGTANARCT